MARAGLAVPLGKVSNCLGTPPSLRIPGIIREIGDEVFSFQQFFRDLSFEEGTVRIEAHAFRLCRKLEKEAFPASLIVIEANACHGLCQVTFAFGPHLPCISSKAFSDCRLKNLVVPASIAKITACAFSDGIRRSSVQFEGPPIVLTDGDFIRSVDSLVMFCYLSY
jgi:hypothetical protein